MYHASLCALDRIKNRGKLPKNLCLGADLNTLIFCFSLLLSGQVFAEIERTSEDHPERYTDTGYQIDLKFEDLVAIIESLEDKSLGTLISKLPGTFKERYVLLHHSKSDQKASPLKPRVLMLGKTAKLVFAYSAYDESEEGCDILQVQEFSDQSHRFSFREVSLCGGEYRISLANPPKCMSCHNGPESNSSQVDPRPLWEPYNVWPQTYQPSANSLLFSNNSSSPTDEAFESELLDSYEKEILLFDRNIEDHYNQFLESSRDDVLYSQLKPFEPRGKKLSVEMTDRLNQLNLRRIARLIKQEEFDPIRHLMIGAATVWDCYDEDELKIDAQLWETIRENAWQKINYRPVYYDLTTQSFQVQSKDTLYMFFGSTPLVESFWSVFPQYLGLNIEAWNTTWSLKGKFANSGMRMAGPMNAKRLASRAMSYVYTDRELSEVTCQTMQSQLDHLML